MKSLLVLIGPAAILGVLSGCAVSEGGVTPFQADFIDRSNAAAAMSERVDFLYNTSFVSMPTTGTAIYSGYAGLTAATERLQTALIGDVVIQANFGTGVINGSINNFEGGTDPDQAVTYEGSLDLSGEIGQTQPNDFDATFVGTLMGEGQELYAYGQLDGEFHGTGAAAVMATSDASSGVAIGGEMVDMNLSIVAE